MSTTSESAPEVSKVAATFTVRCQAYPGYWEVRRCPSRDAAAARCAALAWRQEPRGTGELPPKRFWSVSDAAGKTTLHLVEARLFDDESPIEVSFWAYLIELSAEDCILNADGSVDFGDDTVPAVEPLE